MGYREHAVFGASVHSLYGQCDVLAMGVERSWWTSSAINAILYLLYGHIGVNRCAHVSRTTGRKAGDRNSVINSGYMPTWIVL